MAQRKIIFFIIVWVVFVGIIFAIMMLNKKRSETVNTSGEIKVWITEGTSDDFQKVINGFKKFSPEHKNIKVTVEKKTNDPDKYRILLLSTMTEGVGPDIFMLPYNEDEVLRKKVEPIPSPHIDITDFEKRFDMSVFQWLLTETETSGKAEPALLGVPLGYETLGVFYNSNLMRTGIPKNWNQIEALYADFPARTYTTNLWLGPSYVPNIVDVLTFFFASQGATQYSDLRGAHSSLREYASFADIPTWGNEIDTEYAYATSDTLRSSTSSMKESNSTTLDAFLQGKIGMIIGYPSLVLELEKSEKRSGSSHKDNIFTDQIPQFSNKTRINTARFSYFGISRQSENKDAAAAFMRYLMSEDAQRAALEVYPYWIPAQSNFLASQKGKPLSSVIHRAKIDAFLPNPGEKIILFQYGLKSKFQSILEKKFENTPISALNTLVDEITQWVQCEMHTYEGGNPWDC